MWITRSGNVGKTVILHNQGVIVPQQGGEGRQAGGAYSLPRYRMQARLKDKGNWLQLEGGLQRGGGRAFGVTLHRQDTGAAIFQNVQQAHARRVFQRHAGARHHEGMDQRVDGIVPAIGGQKGLWLIGPCRAHGFLQFGQDAAALITIQVLCCGAICHRLSKAWQKADIRHGGGQVKHVLAIIAGAGKALGFGDKAISADPGAVATPSADDLLPTQLRPGF
jgi:hypothetical protein